MCARSSPTRFIAVSCSRLISRKSATVASGTARWAAFSAFLNEFSDRGPAYGQTGEAAAKDHSDLDHTKDPHL